MAARKDAKDARKDTPKSKSARAKEKDAILALQADQPADAEARRTRCLEPRARPWLRCSLPDWRR